MSTKQTIQQTLIDLRALEKVERHLAALISKISKEDKERNKLIEELEKSNEDIEKLQSLSLKGLFYKVLGSKEEQIEKERQEYLEQFLKLEELNKSLDLLRFEEGILSEKKTKAAGLREQLNQLKRTREKELLAGNTASGKRLSAITKEIDLQGVTIWEIQEAEEAGQAALQILEQIAHFIRSARGWGTWHSRNNRWSDYRRRSNIDQALAKAHQARQQLNVFQRELGDLYQNVPDFAAGLKLDLYQNFLAALFKNMISDWIHQQKLIKAHNNIKQIKTQVIQHLHQLSEERQRMKHAKIELSEEKNAILTQN